MSKKQLQEIGNLVYEIRSKQRKTKNEIAISAGINNFQLTKIENGEVDMHLTTLMRVAKALGVQLADVIPSKK